MQSRTFFARLRSTLAKDLRNDELPKFLIKCLAETVAVVLALYITGLLMPINAFLNAHLPQILKAYGLYLLLFFVVRLVTSVGLQLIKKVWGLRRGRAQAHV